MWREANTNRSSTQQPLSDVVPLNNEINRNNMIRASHRISQWLALSALLALDSPFSTIFAQGLAFTTNTIAALSPLSIAVADFNGDDKPDLSIVNGSFNTVTVLTNNGIGGFGSNNMFKVSLPSFVMTTDVNGDGKLDLICAAYNPSWLSLPGSLIVMTNNGNGIFGSNATLTVGSEPNCIVAADFNGDGKPDLICANSFDSSLTVLTNDGGGVFVLSATYKVGHEPHCAVAADINSDGNPDIITANFSANSLTLLTNNGSGVFGSNATLNVGNEPEWVVAADVNADGYPDLISANRADTTLTVLTNNGYGIFEFNATISVGYGPGYVIAADINNDGKLDLISANLGEFPNSDRTLTVLTNNGSGSFGSNTKLNVGNDPYCIAAIDINRDGLLDLISANYADNTLTVLKQILIPKLTISALGNNLVFLWPTNTAGFTLQMNTNLSNPAKWKPVAVSPAITNGQYQVILPPTNSSAFYRLVK